MGGKLDLCGPSAWRLKRPQNRGGPFLSSCLFSIHKVVISIELLNSVGEKSLQQVANELAQISIRMAYLNRPVYVQPYLKKIGIKTNYPITLLV